MNISKFIAISDTISSKYGKGALDAWNSYAHTKSVTYLIEYIIFVIISGLLIYYGIKFVKFAIHKINDYNSDENTTIMIICGIVIYAILTFYFVIMTILNLEYLISALSNPGMYWLVRLISNGKA